jgi:hypothetical protein
MRAAAGLVDVIDPGVGVIWLPWLFIGMEPVAAGVGAEGAQAARSKAKEINKNKPFFIYKNCLSLSVYG